MTSVTRLATAAAVAVPAVLVALPPLASWPHSRRDAAELALVAIGYLALQSHHTLATARGRRARWLPWTLGAQVALTYAPIAVWPGWVDGPSALLAGVLLMTLPRRWAAAAVVAAAAGELPLALWVTGDARASAIWTVDVLWLGCALYGFARLAALLRELHDTRTELAGRRVGRERTRIARDLHDLLGRDLTGIALTGELAEKLAGDDPVRAEAELARMVAWTREALADLDAVAAGARGRSFDAEVRESVALLERAGVRCSVQVPGERLPDPAQDVLAWALREAVTNTLRHSHATACAITLAPHHGGHRLHVTNDGVAADGEQVRARHGRGEGTGLSVLSERLAEVGGCCQAAGAGAQFSLTVEVPA